MGISLEKNNNSTQHHSLSFGLERLGLISLHYRWLILILTILLSLGAYAGINRINVDDSLSELFRADTPEFKRYERMIESFPSSEYDVLIVIESENILTRTNLQAISELVIELQFIDGLKGLISLFSTREPPKNDTVPRPLIPNELPVGDEFERLRERILNNPIISGKLLSTDGRLALIVIALEQNMVKQRGLEQVIAEIQQIANTQLNGKSLDVKLAGAPVMQLEIRNAVKRDRMIYNGIGFLAGALIAALFFRRFSYMVIAAAPPLIAILWSLGLLGWLNFELNMFLNVMTPLIMVMAFSDTMQITFTLRTKLMEGYNRYEAAKYAVLTVGPACVLTVATAAASFITLLFSSSALIRSFGAAGALSCLTAYVAVITLVPLLAILLISEKDVGQDTTTETEQHRDRAINSLRAICGFIATTIVRFPIIVTIASILIVGTFGYIHLTLEPRYSLSDQVPDREQALEANRRLDKKLTGAKPVHVMIEFPEGSSLYDEKTLDLIGKVHTIQTKQAGVGNVWSIETLRQWLKNGGTTDVEVLKRYVKMLPEHLTRRFISKDQTAAVVTGRIPDINSKQLSPLIEKLEQDLTALQKEYPTYKINVTGLAAIAARNSTDMIKQLNRGLTIEMVFVAFLIGLAFRSVSIGMVSILPALFPIVASGTLLAATGEGLQFASIVALTVSFGLGLDATIHYLNRLRLEVRKDEDPIEGIIRATLLVGPALILTTLVLAFGLAVTIFSDQPSLRLFGWLSAVTLIAALIGDLIILPATTLLAHRIFKKQR